VTLRVIDMFAGVGGFSLGLHRAGGFRTVAVAETDPYASKVLSLRFPDAPNLGDVTKAEYPHADIICAGFPCQDISFAGLGAGLAGTRSGLWREVVRAIRVVGPKYALLENVAALLNRGMGAVLGDLAEVGHDAEWHCIPASAVGAPHRRDRIWIVTHPRGPQHEGSRAPLSGAIAAELSCANASGERWNGCWLGAEPTGRGESANVGETAADPAGKRRGKARGGQGGRGAGRGRRTICTDWAIEPAVGRVAHGVPARVDRLKCLGNAVVPQLPELLGRVIRTAQGTEARRAETPKSGSVHDGPVAKPCAQSSSRNPHTPRGT
jgi:DNA (cytosine-5)-methyltransferase 1